LPGLLGKRFYTGSSEQWGEAAIAAGEDPEGCPCRGACHDRVLHGSATGLTPMHALDVLGDPREIDRWLERFRSHWEPKRDALATEVARGKRCRRPAR